MTRRLAVLALSISALVPRPRPANAAAQETLTPLAKIPVSTVTADKPQSKLWFHAGHWWAVLPSGAVSPSGTWLWRLETTNKWTPVLRVAPGTSTRADAKSFGDVVHVFLWSAAPQLVSLEYEPALDSYVPWSVRPTATPLTLTDSETATIDVDTTLRLWLSTESGSKILTYWSDYPYARFNGPFAQATNVLEDDISVVVALPLPLPSRIGVFWSNQHTERFGFRTHIDGDPPTTWSADEVPAKQSAVNVNGGMADDHMNAAVASDGTLYMAVKTSYNSPSQPLVSLLVRRPNGKWDDLYQVEQGTGTRGIALLNEPLGILRVVYTASSSGGSILYRDSALKPIAFGARHTLISGNLNNATSTKDNWTDSLVVMAGGYGVLFRETGLGTATTTSSTSTTTTVPGQTTTTTTTAPATASALVTADVSVVAGSSTRYGTATKLEVDDSPVKHTYLQFSVRGTAGRAIAHASVKLKVASTTGAESTSRGRIHVAACGWSETTLSGTTSPQPAIDPAVLDAPAGSAVAGTVVTFDVTGAITGDGTYCFALDSMVSDGVDYVAREASSGGPALVISLAP